MFPDSSVTYVPDRSNVMFVHPASNRTEGTRSNLQLPLALLALTLVACGDDRLTGVAAQDAVRQYQAQDVHPDSVPLVLIDGIEVPSAIAMKTDPSTIDSVHVLTSAAARAPYGDRGRNGVILIFLKKPAAVKPRANDAWY